MSMMRTPLSAELPLIMIVPSERSCSGLYQNREITKIQATPCTELGSQLQNDESPKVLGVGRNPCRFGGFSDGTFFTSFYQKILLQKKVIAVQNIFHPTWGADQVKSIIPTNLNIHFLGRCQRSQRPPTRLSRDTSAPVWHCCWLYVLTSLVLGASSNCCMRSSWSRPLARRTVGRDFAAALTKITEFLEFQFWFDRTIWEFGNSFDRTWLFGYDLKNVLQWLANTGTLRREFEENKVGNIRLRRSCAKMSCIIWLCAMIAYKSVFSNDRT